MSKARILADLISDSQITASEITGLELNANLAGINQGLATTDSPTFVTVNATSADIGGWTITESGGSLYFTTSGTNKMKLDASGNLDVVGSVNSSATIT